MRVPLKELPRMQRLAIYQALVGILAGLGIAFIGTFLPSPADTVLGVIGAAIFATFMLLADADRLPIRFR